MGRRIALWDAQWTVSKTGTNARLSVIMSQMRLGVTKAWVTFRFTLALREPLLIRYDGYKAESQRQSTTSSPCGELHNN